MTIGQVRKGGLAAQLMWTGGAGLCQDAGEQSCIVSLAVLVELVHQPGDCTWTERTTSWLEAGGGEQTQREWGCVLLLVGRSRNTPSFVSQRDVIVWMRIQGEGGAKLVPER